MHHGMIAKSRVRNDHTIKYPSSMASVWEMLILFYATIPQNLVRQNIQKEILQKNPICPGKHQSCRWPAFFHLKSNQGIFDRQKNAQKCPQDMKFVISIFGNIGTWMCGL